MPENEEEDISTYVSCPKCMSDSFIKPEVLGVGMCVDQTKLPCLLLKVKHSLPACLHACMHACLLNPLPFSPTLSLCCLDTFSPLFNVCRKLKCSNCGKSFNATCTDIRDINDVYTVRCLVSAATRHRTQQLRLTKSGGQMGVLSAVVQSVICS